MKLPADSSHRQISAPLRGVGFVFISALCFSAMAVGVRFAKGTFRPDTLVFYRSLVQMFILLPWWRSYFPNGVRRDFLQKLQWHFWRGGLGIGSMLLLYLAVHYVPLGMVNQLTMTSVMWATFFAWWILGESLSRAQLAFGGMVIVGVALGIFVSSGGTAGWAVSSIGVGAGLLCGLFMGLAHVVLRKMRRNFGTREIVFFFSLCGIGLMLPAFCYVPQFPHSWAELGLLLLVGLTATLGQLFMTQGFFYATTFTATVTKLSEFVINILLGMWILGEFPPPVFYAGLVLVVVGIGGLAFGRRPIPAAPKLRS